MKDGIDAAAGILDGSGILDVPPQGFHTKLRQRRNIAAGQSGLCAPEPQAAA